MIDVPETRYAKSGDVHIAYQVVGDGPIDVLEVAGFISHVELLWEHPAVARLNERLASFCRLILFDKRGMGLSDPVPSAPTLEQRMDDMRAVMDAAGSERAVLLGSSEGVPASLLFAATHPDRVSALVLWGGMARSVAADDYPSAAPAEALIEASAQFIAPFWGQGATIDIFAPSLADDPQARDFQARLERSAASPGIVASLFQMFLEIDVRDVLPVVRVPTLLLHRRGDRAVNVRHSRWMAERIPDARLIELPGIDHQIFAGDGDAVVDEIEEFLTGTRREREPDRVLATVLFTDIVDSTGKASELGDRRWRDQLSRHDDVVRRQLERYQGRKVKTTGDGVLATFDGPARAIRCAAAIRDSVRDVGLEIRAGLHTGEIELAGDDIAGIGVHIAARVMGAAEPGEVLVSRTVVDLVAGSGLEFDDRGAHPLKGVPGEWHLYAVKGRASGATP